MSGSDGRERAQSQLLPACSSTGDSVCVGNARDTNRSCPPSPFTLNSTAMARKGRKTRWRKLPIPLAHANQGKSTPAPRSRVPVIGGSPSMEEEVEAEEPAATAPKQQQSRVTFNEDEYTKITTPRQDIMFKKGYLAKKKASSETTHYDQSPTSPSESAESCEVQYVEDGLLPQPYLYPSGYIDHNGLFYLNSGSYEVYEPYTGNLTVIMPGGYAGGIPGPMYPVPFHPVEWYPTVYPPQPPPPPPTHKKRNSTDSQNWGSSCESPSSPQEAEPAEPVFYTQPYPVYPAAPFVFPPPQPPVFPVNGMVPNTTSTLPPTGSIPQPTPTTPPAPQQPPPDTAPKRRKKRRKKRRPGMGEEGSESSCEEVGGGGSSDGGQGSSCSKTTDSGVHTAASGADSPQPQPPSDDASDDHWQPARVATSPASGSVTPVSNRPTTPESTACTLEETAESIPDTPTDLPENTPTVTAITTPTEPDASVSNAITDQETENTTSDHENKDDGSSDTPCLSPLCNGTVSPLPEVDTNFSLTNGECESPETEITGDTPSEDTPENGVTTEEASVEQVTMNGDLESPDDSSQHTNGNDASNQEERLIKVQNKDLTILNEVLVNHATIMTDESIEIFKSIPSFNLKNGDSYPENKEDKCTGKHEIAEKLQEEIINKSYCAYNNERLHEKEEAQVNGRISYEEEVQLECKSPLVDLSCDLSNLDLKEEAELTDDKSINLSVHLDKAEEICSEECMINSEEPAPIIKCLSEQKYQEIERIEKVTMNSRTEPANELQVLRIEEKRPDESSIVDQPQVAKEVFPRERIDSDDTLDASSEVKWSNAEENGWASNESESPKSQPLSIETEEVWGLAEEWGVEALPEGMNPEAKPLTEVVTKWLETNWPPPPQPPQTEADASENSNSSTGPKNAEGNPFPALYPSVGTRVASYDEIEEYGGWVAERCRPADWVSRYYRLARSPSPTVHGPFPCGLVCCILQ